MWLWKIIRTRSHYHYVNEKYIEVFRNIYEIEIRYNIDMSTLFKVLIGIGLYYYLIIPYQFQQPLLINCTDTQLLLINKLLMDI